MAVENPVPNSLVSIGKANDYQYVDVYKAVEKCLELIGGLDKIVKRGDNVFVKINHLAPSSPPERGIVTHPVFVKAVVENLKTTGANITVGDDIGTEPVGFSDPEGIDGFQISGIRQVCEESGVILSNIKDAGFIETTCDGRILSQVYISKTVLDADVIVNLPKLKTHALTVYTGGIKNMFGAIPKGQRVRYHEQYNVVDSFNQLLVDVFSAAKPHLTIMDGIIAMEGMGPANGKLRKLGVILASQDTVALDAVATKIIGWEPMSVPTTMYAHERGLGVGNLQNIEIVGESISDVAPTSFELPVTYRTATMYNMSIFMSKLPTFITNFINNLHVIKPRIIRRICVGCFECRKTCAANAISIVDDKALINQRVCIACYCCHEVCRYDAIMIKQALHKRFILYSITKLTEFISRIIRKSG